MAKTYPPFVSSGPDDHGGLIVAITYTFMFISLGLTIVRLYSSYRRKNVFRFNDFFFYAAILLLIPQSILTERAVGEGLGRHIDKVLEPSLTKSYKFTYASQLIGIVIQFLAKLSVALLINRIHSQAVSKRLLFLVEFSIGVWAIFSFFTVAFQCGTEKPWKPIPTCNAGGDLYYVVVSVNILIDALLACAFLPEFWKLQMRRELQVIVSLLFASRLLVCVACFVQIAMVKKYLSSTDYTWYNGLPTMVYQLVVNLSILTAGIPSVHRYISEIQTGYMGTKLTNHEFAMASYAQGSTVNKSENRSKNELTLNSKNSSKSKSSKLGNSRHSRANKSDDEGGHYAEIGSNAGRGISGQFKSILKSSNILSSQTSHSDEELIKPRLDSQLGMPSSIIDSHSLETTIQPSARHGPGQEHGIRDVDAISNADRVNDSIRNGIFQKTEIFMKEEFSPESENGVRRG